MNDDKLDAQLLADLRDEAEANLEGYVEVAAANLLWILDQVQDARRERDNAKHDAWRMLVEYLTYVADSLDDSAREMGNQEKAHQAATIRWQAGEVERKNHTWRYNSTKRMAQSLECSRVVHFLRMKANEARLNSGDNDVFYATNAETFASLVAARAHRRRPGYPSYKLISIDGDVVGAILEPSVDYVLDGRPFNLHNDEMRMVYVAPRCPECKGVLDETASSPEEYQCPACEMHVAGEMVR